VRIKKDNDNKKNECPWDVEGKQGKEGPTQKKRRYNHTEHRGSMEEEKKKKKKKVPSTDAGKKIQKSLKAGKKRQKVGRKKGKKASPGAGK